MNIIKQLKKNIILIKNITSFTPFEAFSNTVNYMMINSFHSNFYYESFLPSSLLYYPLKYTCGQIFSLDDQDTEKEFAKILLKDYDNYLGKDAYSIFFSFNY